MAVTLFSRLSILLAVVRAVQAYPPARPAAAVGVFPRQNMTLMDETPNMPYDPNTIATCTWWWDNDGRFSCSEMPATWGITLEMFLRWNPSITPACGNFLEGRSYCVEAPPESPTEDGGSEPSPTVTGGPGNGIETPQPIQPGMVGNCNQFYFVQTGDNCASIAQSHGIPLERFLEWNPAVGSGCTGIWASTYACVGTAEFEAPLPVTTTATTTTTPGNGVETPSPVQPGMVNNCNKFHFVQTGDSCLSISTANGISEQQFRTWNPAVGTECTGLWANTYACVGILGFTPPTTMTAPAITTTTSPGNGINTPIPTQPGMVNNCDRFYLVQSGDSCAGIASTNGISEEQFRTWNPNVGTDCTGLWANAYACIRIIGFTPPPTTTTRVTTTTRAGNGISTPTPTQPGMINNCDTFHRVRSGDTCASIGAANTLTARRISDWNTSVGSTCSGLWADHYVCVNQIGFTRSLQTTCHSRSDHINWGNNRVSALNAVSSWCSNSGSGSGRYDTAQIKRGCFNAANGNNRIEFVIRNDFGATASITNGRCANLLNLTIERCSRGAEGVQEGWFLSSRQVAGRC